MQHPGRRPWMLHCMISWRAAPRDPSAPSSASTEEGKAEGDQRQGRGGQVGARRAATGGAAAARRPHDGGHARAGEGHRLDRLSLALDRHAERGIEHAGHGRFERDLEARRSTGRERRGAAIDNVIRVASDEGLEMPPLEEGNICVKMDDKKTTGIFTGYLGEPERNKNVFKHQLYYTGDKAYKDEDGYIWFVGRDDDVIKASDYRIGPFEVESILMEHHVVVEAAVVSSPHEIRGFAVKAFVVLRQGETPCKGLAEDLFRYCDQRLATYKIPRIIEFVETLPKTISGKIRRVELRVGEANSKSKKEVRENEFFHAKY